MANRAIWTVRMKHEWLQTPLKGKRWSKRKRSRIGLEAALVRRQKKADKAAAAAAVAE